ncbi:hypothetical protein [Sinorhizobium meliloti]|uniref:hypothetical protein n=1 Tax=Rhizobium meliloti TaxID=382 RepID=UPI0004153FBC|nr:hypothetical protein [Sinorhizobium meliloti]
MARKKGRVDSVTEAVRIATAGDIQFPANVPLDKQDIPFFQNVIAEYARAEWSAHQLEIAAMLARTMADLVREQDLLRSEGAVAYSEKGSPLANPRKAIVQMHASSILSFRRSLALHARAQGGESRDIAKRREAAKGIEEAAASDDDMLLA